MPTPTQTSMSNINSHIGSNRNKLGDSYVRNLANRGGQISFGQCRWGIQFPAYKGNGFAPAPSSASASPDYSANPNIEFNGFHSFPLYWETVSTVAQVAVYYNLFSSGTGNIVESNAQTGNQTAASWNWLQSGSASQYYARMDITGGGAAFYGAPGYSAFGTDLQLSSNRGWVLIAEQNWDSGTSSWVGNSFEDVTGTLTIKDQSFNTILTRPIYFSAEILIPGL